MFGVKECVINDVVINSNGEPLYIYDSEVQVAL